MFNKKNNWIISNKKFDLNKEQLGRSYSLKCDQNYGM